MDSDPEEHIKELTPEVVHNVAFSKPPFGERGYNEDEVDDFLAQLEAALRDPATLTSDFVRRATFSKPPIGKRGYDEGEVDTFLGRVAAHLDAEGRSPSAGRSSAPTRLPLYTSTTAATRTPVLAIDLYDDGLHLIDVAANAVLGSAALAATRVYPADYGNIGVLVISAPGLPELAIRPMFGRFWRGTTNSVKPTHFAADDDWSMLAERFGLGEEMMFEQRRPSWFERILQFFFDD